MSLQRQTYFSVSSVGVPIRNTADYSPFGVQLDGRTVQGDFYRFGYQGSEKDDESKGGGNSYTTFFRQLDPRVGRWFSVDPVFQPWQSPYCSMDNNPIYYNDVKGDSIGVDRSFSGNKTNSKALQEYAGTEQGYAFLAKYAKKGQTIGGKTFDKDGEYHSKGIDLLFVYGGKEPGSDNVGGGGETTKELKTDAHGKTIGATFTVTTWKGKGWQTDNWTYNTIITLFHETLIHVALNTEDFIKDKTLDFSNITEMDKERAGALEHHYQHGHVLNQMDKNVANGKQYLNGTALWPGQAFLALDKISKSWNLNFTRDEIFKAMMNYSGGYEVNGIMQSHPK